MDIEKKDIAKYLADIWQEIPDYKCDVEIFVGWLDDHTDKVNGGYHAEGYTIIGNDLTYMTGRAGMKLLLETGVPLTKITVNGRDITDRQEEFRQFILVGDKPFNV